MKGGAIAWGPIGEGNASVHGAEPTRFGPDWGATGDAVAALATTFVSAAALDAGLSFARPGAGSSPRTARAASCAATWSRTPRCRPSRSPRADGTVTLDGRVLAAEPVSEVPLNRRYFLS